MNGAAKTITAVIAVIGILLFAIILIPLVTGVQTDDCINLLRGQGSVVLAEGQGINFDLIPAANNTYDIGSHPNGYWKEGFFGVNSVHLGDITLSGENGMFSTGQTPIAIEDGLILYNPADESEMFHMFISGVHQQFADIPEAFDNSLVFETSSVDNPHNMEIVFWDTDTERPALVLNKGEAARASVFERSLIVGAQKATKPLDGNYTIGTTDFPNLGFDTSITGADLGVEDDVEILGTLYVDEAAKIAHWFDEELSGNGYAQMGSVMLQWGMATSTQDTAQTFRFPTTFPTGVTGVQITRANADVTEVLPVTAATATSFTVDRNDAIDGNQVFSWLAIGY